MTDGEFRAKLVALFNENETRLGRRQLPLIVDDSLTMVVYFDCVGSSCPGSSKLKNMSRFIKKFELFTENELPNVLKADEIMFCTVMSQVVPCVGCRRSVERLYNQLIDSDYPALDPLFINEDGEIGISSHYMFQPKLLHSLFSRYGSKLNSYVESIPKTRKNRRCLLHSLDSQKVRPAGNWLDVWEQMSKECQQEVVIIEEHVLSETVETYLRKHRFCAECKSKVQQAFKLLTQEADSTNEKGFVASLYSGVSYCHSERHIHVTCDTNFVANLMSRAEPELRGSRREKHAKTIDVAQEEVLVCIGVCLYERLHRISQRTKEEEQTWQLMFYMCVECILMNFELTVDKKLGVSQLELLCEEIQMEELAKQQKREHKRQKRRERKNKLRIEGIETTLTLDNGLNDSFSLISTLNEEQDHDETSSCSIPKLAINSSGLLIFSCSSGEVSDEMSLGDSDFSSGSNGDLLWSSSPSSCDSSCDGAYADSCSSHEDECSDCLWNKRRCTSYFNEIDERDKNRRKELSLEELLKRSCPSDEESYINPEELLEMEAKIRQTYQERLQFRENLRLRFQTFQKLSKFRFRPFVLRSLSNHCLRVS
ncbi:Gametoproteintin-binding protein 2 [Chamberlinius hualienensis]